MNFRIPYKTKDKVTLTSLTDATLDGMNGVRADRYFYERVSSDFAIKEILGEAESFFDTCLDDELSHGLWRCEFWGKQIISACDVCLYKKDDELKEKIRKSAYRVLSYQRQDGYLSTYRDSDNIFAANPEITRREIGWASRFNWNVWGQKYTLWGLIRCALLLDDEEILKGAVKMADFLISQIKRLGVRLKDTGVMDGMPACSILRPMLILYRLTGKEEYFDFCKEIITPWYNEQEKPGLIANALSDKAPAHWYEPQYEWFAKTYEMLSCFEGILEMYKLTADEQLLKAGEGFYTQLVKYELDILGSVGHCAIFGDGAKYADSGTEVCDVIHWMRFCRILYEITAKPCYMESIENAFVNAFLSGVYADGKGGVFMVRGNGQHRFATIDCSTKYQNCCLNNIPRGFSCAATSICAKGQDGFYINLYTPHTAKFGDVFIHTDEGYFDKGNVTVVIRNAKCGEKLHLRIPPWSRNTTVFVGEEEYKVTCPGEYFTLSLKGDTRLRISFDMTARVYELCHNLSELDTSCRHVLRQIDPDNGIYDRSMLIKEPVCVIRRGALLLAKSKKIGSDQEEMFSKESVYGKNAKVTAVSIRHDLTLCLCKVTLEYDGKTEQFLMCDYGSCYDKACIDPKYFTVYI